MNNLFIYCKLLTLIILISYSETRTAIKKPNKENVLLNRRPLNTGKIGECQIDLKDLPSNQPLLLRKGGSKDLFGFYLPDKGGIIHLNPGEQMIVACTGKNNEINGIGVAQVTVSCDGGQYFKTPNINKQLTITDFNCSSFIQHSAIKNSKEKCEISGDSYVLIDIGFELPDKSFYTIMQTCFDEKNLDSIYAKFIQTPSISASQTGEPRPSFIEGKFYPEITVNSKYNKDGQKATFAQLLGSQDLADKYIGESDFYLARGHLTAKADYILSSQQRATFWYVNVAPQWQTFNGGNWMQLESSVRSFTAQINNNLTIYTGTYGISTLPDINNNETPLYLYTDNKNIGKIKVPELFWKVLYEPKSQKAIAFVGINNPYLSDFTPLCSDVCYQIKWLKWKANNQKLGYGYCCDVNELRQTIKEIPEFKVTDLLS